MSDLPDLPVHIKLSRSISYLIPILLCYTFVPEYFSFRKGVCYEIVPSSVPSYGFVILCLRNNIFTRNTDL